MSEYVETIKGNGPVNKAMGELVETGSKYSDEDRRKAVVLYLVLGSDTLVAQESGICRQTINKWRNNADWWEQEADKVAHEIEDKLRAGLRKITLEGTELVLEAIRNKELKGKEAMVTVGIAYDKLRLSENRPTSITGQSTGGIQARLEDIADKMLELERQNNAKLVSPPTSDPESE